MRAITLEKRIHGASTVGGDIEDKTKEANYALPLDGIATRRKQLYFFFLAHDGASPLMLLLGRL